MVHNVRCHSLRGRGNDWTPELGTFCCHLILNQTFGDSFNDALECLLQESVGGDRQLTRGGDCQTRSSE